MINFVLSAYALIMAFLVLFGGADPATVLFVLGIINIELAMGVGIYYLLISAEIQESKNEIEFDDRGIP